MKKYFPILILFFLLCFAIILSAQETISIYFLDVGQGDSSIIVSSSEEVVMIDSGPDESLILNYLQNLGISHIDLLIATHAHTDHITGMDKIIDKYRPRAFIDPGIPHTTKTYEKLLNSIQRNSIKYYQGSSRKIKIGSMLLTILPPADPLIEESKLNNNSIVIRLDFENFSCLFTGDIEKHREIQLLKNDKDNLSVKVFKVPHHGSSTSSITAFIKAVSPEIAIIMCGIGNRYGHPHQEVLNFLQNFDIQILRTDVNGTILLKTDGTSYQILKEKELIGNSLQKIDASATSQASNEINDQEYKYAAARNSDIFHYINCSYVKK